MAPLWHLLSATARQQRFHKGLLVLNSLSVLLCSSLFLSVPLCLCLSVCLSVCLCIGTWVPVGCYNSVGRVLDNPYQSVKSISNSKPKLKFTACKDGAENKGYTVFAVDKSQCWTGDSAYDTSGKSEDCTKKAGYGIGDDGVHAVFVYEKDNSGNSPLSLHLLLLIFKRSRNSKSRKILKRPSWGGWRWKKVQGKDPGNEDGCGVPLNFVSNKSCFPAVNSEIDVNHCNQGRYAALS